MSGLDSVRADLEAKKDRRRNTSQSVEKQPSTSRPGRSRRRRERDPLAVPEGYDPAIWDVALFFQELAEERGFQLAAGLPVIHSRLEHRIGQSNFRDLKRWRDDHELEWVPCIKAMIIDFWDDEVWLSSSAYAIDQFCGVEVFTNLRDRILRELEVKHAMQNMVREERTLTARTGRRRKEPEEVVNIARGSRTRPSRTWDERREIIKRIKEKRSSE